MNDSPTNLDSLNSANYQAILEGIFFVAHEPLKAGKLASMLGIDKSNLERLIQELAASYREDARRGLELECIASGWQLVTKAEIHEEIASFISQLDMRKLSLAARETLAIVAYAGPVTRHEINTLRGVVSDSSVSSLEDKKLIGVVGTQESPGKPSLYAVTRHFLDSFGLRSKDELPDLMEFAPSEDVRRRIEEKLGYLRADDTFDELTGDVEFCNPTDQTDEYSTDEMSALYTNDSMNKLIAESFALSEKIDLASLSLDSTEDDSLYQSEVLDDK